MKISFPKFGPDELVIKKLDAPSIIWSMMIGFFAGLCGSYLVRNHFWLLMIGVLGVVSILLCPGAAVGSFLNDSLEGVAPAFVNIRSDAKELMTKVLAETTDTVCAAPAAEDAAVSRYD
jgi:hypothetical protein